ncbi:potassium transporter [Corallococcus praedator]|uniref:Potassium transporter n=1 Tax=Corallococcus praedator TaxID=2316724 RepID=A0ABX9QLY0_9BACT|nr:MULTISPECIES: cation:proton antiporter [Corallococcus]RKH03599.1 potassium transporter [Corallococcus sp. CA047B]RKH33172.1 potassium transporter [Corallococcus sp. CA031C]RKI11555.1 potassium transporter [Corallococcus praedator]
MHDAHAFLQALATVLCVAAVTTVLFQRLRQPVVLGYILAGFIIGPHVPIPLVADPNIVTTLSELGVILLMFSLGLEFSLRRLVQVGPTAGLTAVIQCSVMVWLGFIVGRAFGWTMLESLFTGCCIAISSTTIIAKAFDEQNIRGALRSIVVGILIVEDLIGILLMAMLTAVSTGSGLSAGDLALTVGKLAAFLVGLVVIGLLVVPRVMRAITKLQRPETTLVSAIGICFAVALLAQSFGYSVALGAFLAGSLVAESGEGKEIEHLVQPVRDLFGAVFFVSVGMLIDPALIREHWMAIMVLTLVVVFGKIISVTLGAFFTGNGTRTSVQAGLSLSQIGEFSFIIAGLGLTLKATGTFLYPVAVAVSAITTLTTPWLIRASGPLANWVDRKLPAPLQTFASLYGSWVENLRTSPRQKTVGARVRRMAMMLLLDAALLTVIVIGTSVMLPQVTAYIDARIEGNVTFTPMIVIGLGVALALPFCVGIVRVARRLGVTLAEGALPAVPGGKVDLAAAPRRMLVVALQLASIFMVGAPVVAITQPFLPGFPGAVLLLIMLGVLGFAFWQSATHLQGHMRAGAQVIVEALAAQSHAKGGDDEPAPDVLHGVRQLLPGLGEPESVALGTSSAAVGRTLAELNLRGMTGATVLAIRRGTEGVLVPSAQEVLRAGDILALAGTHEAIDAAKGVLGGGVGAGVDAAPV